MSPENLLAARNLRREWDARKDALGLTQEKAAAAMGFATQSAVSQYLLGQVALNTEAVLKFARLLGVDPINIDPRIAVLLPPPRHHAFTEPTTPDIPNVSPGAELATLLPIASPRARADLERIARAAAQGRLTEADLALLWQIAERLAGRE